VGVGGGQWWAISGVAVAILLGCQIGCHGVRGEYVREEYSVHLSGKGKFSP